MQLDVKKNTIVGAVSGVLNKFVVTILPFIMRTIIIYYMGTQYLGLSSLFSSILNVLSLAELGFGTALVYSMYKPIAENDTETICALMTLYKKIYRVIGLIILIIGFTITPSIQYLINGEVPADINIYVLYWIYLFNTVVSYFLFAYKNSLFIAFQRYDISNNVGTVLTVVEYIIQIMLVMVFRNYYCYAIIFPIFTIIGNLVRADLVKKMYPQYICKGTVNKHTKKAIYKNTLALASHKIGNTISTSFDSVVVSAFLGLSSVAIFGNYNYVVTTIMSFIGIIYYSMTPGIGNRMNLRSIDENYKEFKAITSFNNIILCWATGCMMVLYEPFIELWTGSRNLLGIRSAAVFSIYFYAFQSRKVVLLYKDAAGLWKEDKWKPVTGAFVNLAINIILVQWIGIDGVILSSIISFIMIEIPWESVALYKFYFKKRVREYVLIEFKALALCIPCWIMLWLICAPIKLPLLAAFFVKGIICALLPLPYLWLTYRKDKEFIEIMSKTLPNKLRRIFLR